jgi:hypothetical protein
MGNGLNLPFYAYVDSGQDGQCDFCITDVIGGNTAILGEARGSSRWGDSSIGVNGVSDIGTGVIGTSASGTGVIGQGGWNGVQGVTANSSASGVWGENTGGGVGVGGKSANGTGVIGQGGWNGVQGVTANSSASGVWGENTGGGFGVGAKSASGPGVSAQGNPAGMFNGDVLVTGDVILVNSTSGDIAEDFDVEDARSNLEAGTVLIINADGKLSASDLPYDTRVAGVVSGAGGLRPAVVLQRVPSGTSRSPIALLGKAYCKVDATFGNIEAGDLLTTSATPGHAMKVSDKSRALGAIIGKALARFEDGCGLIPIMVSLR